MLAQLLKPRLRHHHVVVSDNRPVPGRPTLTFKPFFLATCDCGWIGLARQSSDDAFREARAHTDHVDEHVDRPFG